MDEKHLEQAADWLDRINELTDDEYRQFTLWLTDSKNKEAFKRIKKAFSNPNIQIALNKSRPM